MVLDGVMVILASICMTVWHPGYGFAKRWNDAKFPFRIRKATNAEEEPQTATATGSDNGEKVEPNVSEAPDAKIVANSGHT